MRTYQYLKNVSTLRLDKSRCTNCRSCLKVCPQEVFSLVQHSVEINALDNCMECGACQRNCEAGAIAVNAGVGCAAAIIGSVFSSNGGCGC